MSDMPITEPAPPHCSFCGKPASKAIGLISNGEGLSICDECILACLDSLSVSLQVPMNVVHNVIQYRRAIMASQERAEAACTEFAKLESEQAELVFPNGKE